MTTLISQAAKDAASNIDNCYGVNLHTANFIQKAIDTETAALKAEIAELRRDKERIEFLERQYKDNACAREKNKAATARAAIDLEIAKENK